MSDIALPMVGALGIAGVAGDCRERLAEYEGSADRVILGGAWVGATPDRVQANHRAILRTFAPGH